MQGAVSAHLTYIGRRGELEVEIDDGQRLRERTELKASLEEWRLDLTSGQYRPKNKGRGSRLSKLVHNIVLSMPARTPPDKVLTAAKKFARERFALQHRYAPSRFRGHVPIYRRAALLGCRGAQGSRPAR